MKILLVNFALRANFGGVLQCYALQEALTELGHDVVKADLPKREIYSLSFQTVKEVLRRLYVRLIARKSLGVLEPYYRNLPEAYIFKNVTPFIEEHINMIRVNSLNELDGNDYDAVVVGSDQIWRKDYTDKLLTDKCINDNAFLGFTKEWNVKRVAYAGSLGLDYWEYDEKETSFIKEMFSLFDGISVREKSAVSLIHDNVSPDLDVQHVLDPTLLHDKYFYINLLKKKRVHKSSGTLLTYILDGNPDKENIIKYVEKKYGLKKFMVNNPYYDDVTRNRKERLQLSMEQWLQGFCDAKFVVADSFHACVFSIIFEIPFYVIANKQRGITRLESLLEMFELKDRIVYDITDVKDNGNEIDWSSVRKILERKQTESLNFIRHSLSN